MSAEQQIFTLGVEEEYGVVNPLTRQLSPSGPQIFERAQRVLGEQVQREIRHSQLEATTAVCTTLAQVRQQLGFIRGGLIRAAAEESMCIIAAGTHPFSHWSEQPITVTERYTMLTHMYQQFTREMVIFGCHVHVGIEDQECAVQVVNRARLWLAPLMALAANSPFWLGADTGYDSYRATILGRWPVAGPPPYFVTYADYQTFIHALIATGCVPDAHTLYWELRPSDHLNTVEFRVTDTCLTIDEAVMITGLVRALVRTCYQQSREGHPSSQTPPEFLRAAHWHSARSGITGMLLDPHTQQMHSAQTLIRHMLSWLRPALEQEGDWHEVSSLVERTLRHGNGATRQRQHFQRRQNYADVVDALIAETSQQTSEVQSLAELA